MALYYFEYDDPVVTDVNGQAFCKYWTTSTGSYTLDAAWLDPQGQPTLVAARGIEASGPGDEPWINLLGAQPNPARLGNVLTFNAAWETTIHPRKSFKYSIVFHYKDPDNV